MTEDDKDRLRQAKADVTAALAAVRIADYRLGEVDARIEDYVREVSTNPDGHNLYEQLGVLRFFGFCRRYGVNATEVQRFFTLYESLYMSGTYPNGYLVFVYTVFYEYFRKAFARFYLYTFHTEYESFFA